MEKPNFHLEVVRGVRRYRKQLFARVLVRPVQRRVISSVLWVGITGGGGGGGVGGWWW